ncbi:MAG TPA: hypothetical protein VK141_05165 [Nitrosomonas sp.]|nr:hypothetical protein [Nitrosomonas sp.]
MIEFGVEVYGGINITARAEFQQYVLPVLIPRSLYMFHTTSAYIIKKNWIATVTPKKDRKVVIREKDCHNPAWSSARSRKFGGTLVNPLRAGAYEFDPFSAHPVIALVHEDKFYDLRAQGRAAFRLVADSTEPAQANYRPFTDDVPIDYEMDVDIITRDLLIIGEASNQIKRKMIDPVDVAMDMYKHVKNVPIVVFRGVDSLLNLAMYHSNDTCEGIVGLPDYLINWFMTELWPAMPVWKEQAMDPDNVYNHTITAEQLYMIDTNKWTDLPLSRLYAEINPFKRLKPHLRNNRRFTRINNSELLEHDHVKNGLFIAAQK